jgi:hypothetical protein
MSAPQARYATTLQSAISASSGSIVVNNIDLLGGKSSGGTANAAIAEDSFIRLLSPNPSDESQYLAEVMQVTALTQISGVIYQLDVQRTDASFIGSPFGSPAIASGVYAPDANGDIVLTTTAGTNYAFPEGAVVENLSEEALLLDVSAGAALDHLVYNYDNGSVRFVNVGATGSANHKVDSGMTVSVFGDYAAVSGNRINLGSELPNVEYRVELQHRMPDGRYFYFTAHKVAITPENTDFAFDPANWIGSALAMDCLKSKNPAHAANPIGFFDIMNDPVTLLPVEDETDEYSVGVYDLFLTATSASKALQRGLPTTRFSVGNVRVGNLRSPKQFLEHLVGIPQDMDKKILIRRQFQLETTIEQLNANNIALLFDGGIEATQQGWRPFNSLITVSSAPAAPWGVQHVWHPLQYIKINVA